MIDPDTAEVAPLNTLFQTRTQAVRRRRIGGNMDDVARPYGGDRIFYTAHFLVDPRQMAPSLLYLSYVRGFSPRRRVQFVDGEVRNPIYIYVLRFPQVLCFALLNSNIPRNWSDHLPTYAGDLDADNPLPT